MIKRDVPVGGFTLIEIVVALAILGISFSILMNIIGNGLDLTRRGKMEMIGVSLAQSLLASVGEERPLQNEDAKGEFTGGFHWRLQVEPYGNHDERDNWPIQAFSVTAVVSWTEQGSDKFVKLSSLRLAPKETWQ